VCCSDVEAEEAPNRDRRNRDEAAKFERSMSWTVYHREFGVVADHNAWAARERAQIYSPFRRDRPPMSYCRRRCIIPGHCRCSKRPLEKPRVGGGLPATAQCQDAAGQQIAKIIRSGCKAVVPPVLVVLSEDFVQREG
jgi:hypothetical protein